MGMSLSMVKIVSGVVTSYNSRTGVAVVEAEHGTTFAHIAAIYGRDSRRFPKPGDRLRGDLDAHGRMRTAVYEEPVR